MQEVTRAVGSAVKKLFSEDIDVVLDIPDESFGDYSTNVAMRLAGKLKRPPTEIAKAICDEISAGQNIECQVAGPGFINFKLTNNYWSEQLKIMLELGDKFGQNQQYKGKTVVCEYSDPNPFKVLHVGHLYTSMVGDAIANLMENGGAKVYRVNFGGDVGLHVAKTLYAIVDYLGGENPDKLKDIKPEERSAWLGEMYIKGTAVYESDEQAKKSIQELNKKIYEIADSKNDTSPLGKIYQLTRDWSYEYFKDFYSQIGSHFDRFYPESETAGIGKLVVEDGLKAGVFKRSEGAVVFEAEQYGLHTRVFINSQGLPTYETKDLGLMKAKKRDYNPDLSVIITGSEQTEYMKVVIKAMSRLDAKVALGTKHLTHGLVKLAGGKKMSSRLGNILGAQEVLDINRQANQKLNGQDEPMVALAAVRYSFLKQRLGADIVFDPEESVSLAGNSGPYIQYAHARACSILAKAGTGLDAEVLLEGGEIPLAKKIINFEEIIRKATSEFHPHFICTYLFELAGEFNKFYEQNRVIGDERQVQRLALIRLYQTAIKNGLKLLGMPAPEKLARQAKS